jgi:hypothetical protein
MKDHLTAAFRDDEQLADVCNVLCEHASLPGLWSAAHGPTEKAERLLAADCPGLSAGQRVTFLSSWELWDEDRVNANSKAFHPYEKTLRLGYILCALTGKYLLPLSTLLVAMASGPAAVDAWLSRNRLPYPK